MMAWMLLTNDHSFYEIMLAAAEFVPADAQVVQGMADFERIMPR